MTLVAAAGASPLLIVKFVTNDLARKILREFTFATASTFAFAGRLGFKQDFIAGVFFKFRCQGLEVFE
ncbi:MAG: hypothetical protein V3W41_01480 [Planctomycetota bacterium]